LARRGVSEALRVWVHGGFNLNANSKDMQYDVAVITLQHPVLYPDLPIKPIRLASPNQDFLEKQGRQATVACWGYTKTGGQVSRRLRQLQYPIRGPFELHQLSVGLPTRPDDRRWRPAVGGQRCLQWRKWGPLFAKNKQGRYTQIGIASWAPYSGCGDLIEPDVYAEVNNPSIRSFIRSAASR
jgi:hypothetical protein